MFTKRFYHLNNSVKTERNYPMDYAYIVFCQPEQIIPYLAN